jgi:glycosyltransferase involved in cell wall biosynthesis
MRILIAGSTYPPALNGQAVFTGNLVEGLVKHGHEVYAIVPSGHGQAYHTQKNGVEIDYLKTVSLSIIHPLAIYTPFYISQVKHALKTFKPDIIHIQDHYPMCAYVVKAAKRHGIKVIGTNHFMPENLAPVVPQLSRFKSAFNWLAWQWMLMVFNQLDVAASPSKTAASIFKQHGLKIPVYPVSCGVSLDSFHPKPEIDKKVCRVKWGLDPDRTTFLFVGRVDGEKRLDVILQALHLLKRDDIQLAIVGNGAALNGLKSLTDRLNIGEQVRFTGFIPVTDLSTLLNSVDIFVMPSEAELLSIATLEAMACGLPVLAAEAQALPELVSQGINGYLFKPGNIEDAAKYMAILADQPEDWPSMRKASLDKVKHHSLENTINTYAKIYETLFVVPQYTHFPDASINIKLKSIKQKLDMSK